MREAMFGSSAPPVGERVTARLNARMRPLDRGDVYEDPLDDEITARALGEVTGGGTLLTEDGEIRSCDIEIALAEVSDQTLDALKGCLEALGAPRGSTLVVESDGREIPFGANEGLAVYLNGTDLPDNVYHSSDVNHVFSEFDRLLGENGSVQSYWEGPTETALYLYGPSYDAMVGCLRDFLDSYPLCRMARLEKIA